MARAAVREPTARLGRVSPPRRDAHARGIALPGGEGTRDQTLVVPGLARASQARVGIGGIEEGDAGVQGRVQRLQRPPAFVTVGRSGGRDASSHGERERRPPRQALTGATAQPNIDVDGSGAPLGRAGGGFSSRRSTCAISLTSCLMSECAAAPNRAM